MWSDGQPGLDACLDCSETKGSDKHRDGPKKKKKIYSNNLKVSINLLMLSSTTLSLVEKTSTR